VLPAETVDVTAAGPRGGIAPLAAVDPLTGEPLPASSGPAGPQLAIALAILALAAGIVIGANVAGRLAAGAAAAPAV
jgi:hypothetical protein